MQESEAVDEVGGVAPARKAGGVWSGRGSGGAMNRREKNKSDPQTRLKILWLDVNSEFNVWGLVYTRGARPRRAERRGGRKR